MQAKRSDPALAQRAIVLQVLRDDHSELWSRAELRGAISDLHPAAVDQALAMLEAENVVIVEGEHVRASRCARHLDALGLVSV